MQESGAKAITNAILRGRRIEAIKLQRKATGVGLAEAKAAVEKEEAELRISSPERFEATAGRKGCLGGVLVFALVTILVVRRVLG